MSRKKILKAITDTAVVVATILAWLSGYIVMQIVYDSIAASVTFGTVWAIIVFCESRFSYISLKSDGKIAITKEEVKSNLWQIIASTLVALLVAIPLELDWYKEYIIRMTERGHPDLGMQINALGALFPTHWLTMSVIALIVIVIFQLPIFIRMVSED